MHNLISIEVKSSQLANNLRVKLGYILANANSKFFVFFTLLSKVQISGTLI